MRHTQRFLSALALLTIPALSFADFNYTSAEFDYIDVDSDFGPFNVDGDGFGIGGTYQVADSFFIGGSLEDYDFSFGVDGQVLKIGGGYFHPLDEDLDFVATFGYVDAEASAGNTRRDDDGLALAGGVRAQLADDIEVDAMLEYVNMDRGGGDTGIALHGRYYFSDEFAVQLKLTRGTDFETFAIGVRAEFGGARRAP